MWQAATKRPQSPTRQAVGAQKERRHEKKRVKEAKKQVFGVVVVFIQAQPATLPVLNLLIMNAYLIYALLEAQVLPVLREYQSDLTVQDRNTLSAYTGPFLLSYRPTGTNLLLLGEARDFLIGGDARSRREQSEEMETFFDRKRAEVSWALNTHFLHFDGHEFHVLSRASALTVVDGHRERLLGLLNT